MINIHGNYLWFKLIINFSNFSLAWFGTGHILQHWNTSNKKNWHYIFTTVTFVTLNITLRLHLRIIYAIPSLTMNYSFCFSFDDAGFPISIESWMLIRHQHSFGRILHFGNVELVFFFWRLSHFLFTNTVTNNEYIFHVKIITSIPSSCFILTLSNFSNPLSFATTFYYKSAEICTHP